MKSSLGKFFVKHPELGGRLVLGIPFGWLILFFAIPFLILLRISFTDLGEHLDPFSPIFRFYENSWHLHIKFQNFATIFKQPNSYFGDTIYVESYLLSLKYAFLTTFFCLIIGYPFAYFLARSNPLYRPTLLLLVMLPFWTSFLLRVYAWKGILADQGIVNNFLIYLGVINEPIEILYTDVSMLVGMTYVYLPFMVLPLYSTLVKMDIGLVEASQDLGASPWKTFWLITVPLSHSGIVAGSMLVFIPCVGEFVIPSLLGGAQNVMIGRVVWDEMFSSNDWPRACALAIIMIVTVILPFVWYSNWVKKKSGTELLT